MKLWSRLVILAPGLFLTACDLAPVYTAPTVELPVKFKEQGVWQLARPSDRAPGGAWWTRYGDRTLDRLESRVDAANQTLAEAAANESIAQDDVLRAQSNLYPTVGFGAQLSGNRQSANRPLRSSDQPSYYGDNQLLVQSSYEVDLWGRVRDIIKGANANAEAARDLLETVRLGLHADVARTYVALRAFDRQERLLADTVRAYQNALDLTQHRLTGKIASPIDVARAEAQLQTARALLDEVHAGRARVEHALATLTGQPAATFSIPPSTIEVKVPRGPIAAPTTLLERRPDIAARERELAAANDAIGVARAAFFPRLFLNLSAGTQDTGLRLLDMNNSLFSVGPAVSLPLFDGGLRHADLQAALAARDAAAARYKATILAAVQQVEDALAEEHHLGAEAEKIAAAVKAESKVLDLSLTLYRDGATTYLDVVTAQTALLEQQRAQLDLIRRRLAASIDLFVALGGDWTEGTLVVATEGSTRSGLPPH